jgi:hypothetical protein
LDTLEKTPAISLLSAQEAKDRLREIVEGFFFRRLRRGMQGASGDCSSKARLGYPPSTVERDANAP